jgi:hypothetical protein
MEHHMSEPWLLNFEIAYDSGFQNGPNVSPMLPVSSAWRFGVRVLLRCGGVFDVNKTSQVPVTLSGRGDLVGSYRNPGRVSVGTYLDVMRVSNAPMRNALDHLGQSTRRCL